MYPSTDSTSYIYVGGYFLYPQKASRELGTVPPGEPGTVPPLGGAFSHYKIRGFEDFCSVLLVFGLSLD